LRSRQVTYSRDRRPGRVAGWPVPPLAGYDVPVIRALEDAARKPAAVWRLIPAQP